MHNKEMSIDLWNEMKEYNTSIYLNVMCFLNQIWFLFYR